MKVVIEISEEIYDARQDWVANPKRIVDEVDIAIANGTPLPKGHGRLIDADTLVDGFEDNYEFCEALNATPTIIEADKN